MWTPATPKLSPAKNSQTTREATMNRPPLPQELIQRENAQGLGVGGTRFAKFPIPGEPISIHEKLEDAAVVNQLCRMTPTASPHFPWDRVEDPAALKQEAAELGLGFDAVN